VFSAGPGMHLSIPVVTRQWRCDSWVRPSFMHAGRKPLRRPHTGRCQGRRLQRFEQISSQMTACPCWHGLLIPRRQTTMQKRGAHPFL
jgi:hypothetical protein